MIKKYTLCYNIQLRSTIHMMVFEIEYYKTEKCFQDFNYLYFEINQLNYEQKNLIQFYYKKSITDHVYMV